LKKALKEIEIVEIIIQKVAEKKGEDRELVWQRFKRGLFSGEMMHLRDIEETFGKGSLRILASLESEDVPVAMVKKYFESENETEKNAIAREISEKK
jgi:hypothetical protein